MIPAIRAELAGVLLADGLDGDQAHRVLALEMLSAIE